MKFTELEELMSQRGANSLADIARALKTTPQAVSNWKARDQVPYHIISKLNKTTTSIPPDSGHSTFSTSKIPNQSSVIFPEENTISISDIFLTLSEQLKIILLAPFITVFLTFTYLNFIQKPQYESWATILIPKNNVSNLGGLAGLASQFGVNMPSDGQADLSSPTVIPELLRSRTFAEKILDKNFFTKKYNKELSLLEILTSGDQPSKFGKDKLIATALSALEDILEFEQSSSSAFSVIKVTTFEPVFAHQLADVVLEELEALNRFFKNQTTNQKIVFIDKRIASVKSDLELSERRLKEFNEQNRQISSPALQLELDRLTREVEVQKEIYLVLKQQQELAKIDEVQEASILQVLDEPQTPLGPINNNIKLGLFVSFIFGSVVGIIIGLIRGTINKFDFQKRKKLRRGKRFIKKKIKDFIFDKRILGILIIMFFFGLPYYTGHQSENPVFFGMYSTKALMGIILYIFLLIFFLGLFSYSIRTKKTK